MSDSYDILISGIGGQGVVLVSNILGEACVLSGKKAVSGEMFGLAQRSGSVFIQMRIGENVMSPLIPYGNADVVLAFEISEALRYLYFLKPGGLVVSNTLFVHPPGESQNLVKRKIDKYVTFDEIINNINKSGARLIQVDALEHAKQAGNAITENIAMLGALCAVDGFPLESEKVEMAIRNILPEKITEVNIKSFQLGYSWVRKSNHSTN